MSYKFCRPDEEEFHMFNVCFTTRPPTHKAIKDMHAAKMYKQMVIYWESCESGSMFNRLLPKDINVFATTAANPSESSYACYPDHGVFLGDVSQFSIKFCIVLGFL